ncbi:MAG: xanthine permease [Chloroflexi bacterium]|nr:MAG: xanthine permease [Anaerolineaceae bacterium 4572_32.2]RLC78475.1 MAG: xanthine permease [Chloroflexota bacterium]RLC84001.1 MAG: xanthine permease [Chloroflexota bacterium]
MSASTKKVMGYLPNDVPPIGQLILLGFQHVLTMFPATVFCALFTGFHVSTVLSIAGLATIVALVLSKWRIGKFIPLFYGSSFSYLTAYLAITNAEWGVPASDDLIRVMQAGILVTGVINIIVGYIIKQVGKAAVDKVLPPVITGSVACVIGIGLGFAALDMAGANWLISIVTLVVTILFSVYLRNKGFIGMIPILLGAIVGYIVSIPFGLINLSSVGAASWIVIPHITFPSFGGAMVVTAIFSISIMAIATIPESTAHLYQISLYVDRFAEETGQEKYELDQHIGFNLILDGIGDFINGLFGSTAGTNYGENNSLMAITRNYSGPVLVAAGVISILLGFVGKLEALVGTVPLAVSGGLAIYLFGVIGMQGIALMVENKVNLFDARTLAVGAVIMIIGIGGNIGYPGGFLPIPILQGIFPSGLPAIATGAVAGIFINAIFLIFKAPED